MPLVASPRHRAADLLLWQEQEQTDRLYYPQLARSGKIEHALAVIRQFAAAGPALVSVSWGKDSVVLAHLCTLAAPQLPLVHLRPSNHNPDTDRVRDAYLAGWPQMRYYEYPVDYGRLHAQLLSPPELDRQTDQLWHAAWRTVQRQLRTAGRHLSGVRAGEGPQRRLRYYVWGECSPRTGAPLSCWTTADVFAYLVYHDLPIHPVYAMNGGGRWSRDWLRVAEIGDTKGTGGGRRQWEEEYYPDVLRRLETGQYV